MLDIAVHIAPNLTRARKAHLPATLSLEEWTRTVADFAGKCAYCGARPIAVLDHFVPVHRGGGTTAGNCLPACGACNGRKTGKMPDELPAEFPAAHVRGLASYLRLRSTGEDVIPRAARVPKRAKMEARNVRVLVSPADLEVLDALVARLRTVRRDVALTRTDLLREAVDEYVARRRPEAGELTIAPGA